MADIGNEIDAIRAAKYGEEVREDIADALEKMNEQAAAAQEWATGEDDQTAEPSATNNAEYFAGQAAASAEAAAGSAASGIAALANEAPTYSASATYAVGDFVLYGGDLYCCKTAITTAEAWTAAHWTLVKIGPEVTDIKNALKRTEVIYSKDHVYATDFTETRNNVTYTTDAETEEITVTNGGTSSYASLQTPTGFLRTNLVPGRVYRLHATIQSVSGSPNTSIGIYGISGYADNLATRAIPRVDGEAFVDFVATPYMNRIALFMSYGSSTKNSVAKFSNIWIREYSTSLDNGAEYAFNRVPVNIFGIKQPINIYEHFRVVSATGEVNQTDTNMFATEYVEIPDGEDRIVYMRMALTNVSTTLGLAFYDSSKTYVSGELAIVGATVNHAELSEVVVPSNVKYARFSYFMDPAYPPFMVYGKRSLFNRINGIADSFANQLETTEGTAGKAVNYKTGAVADSSTYKYYTVALVGETKLAFTRPTVSLSTSNVGMAFYDSNDDYISGMQIGVKLIAGYDIAITDVPEGATTAKLSWWNDENEALYSPYQKFAVYDITEYENRISVERFNDIDKRTQNVDNTYNIQLGLHTKPESVGMLNVIKRCRQMTDIKWTPAIDLPRLMMVDNDKSNTQAQYYEGVFKAGTEYTGIPYGRANDMGSYGYDYGFVGKFVDFGTFISSVSNPDSMLCKESTFDLADHESVKYAAVCSALTCYALNVGFKPTAEIPDIAGLNLIGKINDNGTLISESEFHLGDVLNLQGYHTAMVTDIVRDADGALTFVELSEATVIGLADKNYDDGQLGGLCRRKGWTREQIYNLWGDYSIYRYANIDSVPYTPSKYVNVGDELDMIRTYHFPCMTYAGEGFKYKSGYIPNTDVIISPNLGYDKLRVFKDGTEISGSPFAVTSDTEKISTGFSSIGEYEAYLCTMSNGSDVTMSMKCHWSVVN